MGMGWARGKMQQQQQQQQLSMRIGANGATACTEKRVRKMLQTMPSDLWPSMLSRLRSNEIWRTLCLLRNASVRLLANCSPGVDGSGPARDR